MRTCGLLAKRCPVLVWFRSPSWRWPDLGGGFVCPVAGTPLVAEGRIVEAAVSSATPSLAGRQRQARLKPSSSAWAMVEVQHSPCSARRASSRTAGRTAGGRCARSSGGRVALDARVVGEREALLDADVELVGELVRALREFRCCRERASHICVRVLDVGRDDGAEELEDVLLVDGLVLRPALALDDSLTPSFFLADEVTPRSSSPAETPWYLTR
jgi:hypothetical protein